MHALLPTVTADTPNDGIDGAIPHACRAMWAIRHRRAWIRADPMDAVAAHRPWLSRARDGLPAARGLGELVGRLLSVEIGIRGWPLDAETIRSAVADAALNVRVRAGLSLGEREALIARLCDESQSLSKVWTEAVLASVRPTSALQGSPGFSAAEAALALSEARRSELCPDKGESRLEPEYRVSPTYCCW